MSACERCGASDVQVIDAICARCANDYAWTPTDCGAQRGPCRVRRGIVTTHPVLVSPLVGPHYAATCCGAARCIERLQRSAKRTTALAATFKRDRVPA